MKFRVLVMVCMVVSGCLHQGADAVSTAMGALVMQAVESRECVDFEPIIVEPVLAPVSVEDELRALVSENPRLGALILTTVWCNPDDRQMFRWQISQAESDCRAAWGMREGSDEFGPEESRNMLQAKVAYESFIVDCGGTRDEEAYIANFWAQVWKPGDPWSPQWDGCFSTPPNRADQYGAVLEYYDEEEGDIGHE